MKTPPPLADEAQRQAALDALDAVYSPAEERFDRITRLAMKIFDVPIALVSLVTARCQWFKSAQGLLVHETPREISFCGHAIGHHGTFIVEDALEHPDFADNALVVGEPHVRFYAGHPVRHEGRAVGTLCVIDTRPRHFDAGQLDTLRNLAGWVENEFQVTAFSAEQRALLSELGEARREALMDHLTKVWNRRGMEELLGREEQRAKRNPSDAVVLLIDVDDFKHLNDHAGHVVGDCVLKEIAQRLRRGVRPGDVVARYGGDEFLVYLADCTPERARLIAERILRDVSQDPLHAKVGGLTSLSMGMCGGRIGGDQSIEAMIARADAALYEAKKAGRGCLRASGEEPQLQATAAS